MKNLTFTAIAAFTVAFCSAQTAVTDFSTNDCEGNPHTLFTELDEGKVIVISWMMPCGSCFSPTYTAYNEVGSYKTSHPDKVKMYICDDYANTSCSSIKSFSAPEMTTDGATFFSSSSIKMSDYGSAGMPKIVILASDGTSNIVYFNKTSGVSSTNVQDAIDAAIAGNTTGINKDIKSVSNFSVFPNPSNGLSNITFSLNQTTNVSINIYNQLGELVSEEFSGQLSMGENTIKVNTSGFDNGVYFVKIYSSEKTSTRKLIVSR